MISFVSHVLFIQHGGYIFVVMTSPEKTGLDPVIPPFVFIYSVTRAKLI